MPKAKQAAKNTAGLTVAQQVDRELAAEALKRRQAGQQPTRRELAALRRVEKEREESLRWEYYRSIPQKHWREMSGRQTKVINEQAQRYGIPFGGRTVDLPAVVRELHDFLARNARQLAAFREGPTDEMPLSPHAALARIRADRQTFEFEKDRGAWVEVDPVCRLIMRTVSECRAVLDQVPDQVIAQCPQDLPPDVLADIRARCVRVIDGVYATLAEINEAEEVTGKRASED